MGIAGFYLWLQRWYTKCVEEIPQDIVDAAIEGNAIPKKKLCGRRYDNLYIDMNGLIHPCCHDTAPLPEPESEEEMLDRMFKQLDLLVQIVQPKKCLILCIDGVAPRSKMNQQRSRRFRAAEEREESDAIAAQAADKIEHEYGLPRPRVRSRWDHNQITPSTSFMERVGLGLEWFIMKKMNSDSLWRKLVVVFSDAHVPGEGEHKIMHFIRGLRTQKGYDGSTSHVIHGMDADLVCLGLSTHEEHVSILRNQLTETYQPDHSRFCYFNLHTYRENLKGDFGNIKDMNFERVIDDFIFLCFFVGNDFLPHVPLISIKTKGIELLLDHYVRSFQHHSYLTKGGEVRYERLGTFLRAFIAAYMPSLLKEYNGVLRAKERAKQNVEERTTAAELEIQALRESLRSGNEDKQEVSNKLHHLLTSLMKERYRYVAGRQELGFSYLEKGYRDRYYLQKFGWDPKVDRDAFESNVKQCCAEYFRGTQWVMRYYTKGCPSWEWYYPYHYAPLLQDLADFDGKVDVEMNVSAPLHPVEQLLAVLPRSSLSALPEELHEAVMDPKSVLGPFYPESVDVDYSEANFSYQGVLRLPFIDCNHLKKACGELAELEADLGTTLVFCHQNHPVVEHLESLLSRATSETSTGKNRRGSDHLVFPISQEIASLVPIAGRIGKYQGEWPRNAELRCPDQGVEKTTPYGSLIPKNAVHCYRYELNTHADYLQYLLREKESRKRKSSDAKADSDASVPISKRSKGEKQRDVELVGLSKKIKAPENGKKLELSSSPSRDEFGKTSKKVKEAKGEGKKSQITTTLKHSMKESSSSSKIKHQTHPKQNKIYVVDDSANSPLKTKSHQLESKSLKTKTKIKNKTKTKATK